MREEVPVHLCEAPRFDIDNEKEEMLDYIEENGYAIIREVASSEQVERARNCFWDYLENCTERLLEKGKVEQKIDRRDITTWNGKQWLPDSSTGILNQYGFAHSKFMWDTRLLPKVKRAFAAIWDDADLLVSFDAGNAFRPWKYNPEFLTSGGWWHVDQNGLKPERMGRVCVQGLVTYYDATEDTGGFCFVPGSHKHFKEVCERSTSAKLMVDFVSLDKYDPLLQCQDGFLLAAKAGDLILWDSRLVHCNCPALSVKTFQLAIEAMKKAENQDLIRLVGYTCMLPRTHANQEVIENRKKALMRRIGTSHWPNQNISYLSDDKDFYQNETVEYLSTFPKEMLLLVGYTEEELHRMDL